MPKRFGKIFAYTMQKVNNLTWTPGHNGLEERRTDQEAHELTYRAPCDHEYHASLPRFTKPQLFLPEQSSSLSLSLKKAKLFSPTQASQSNYFETLTVTPPRSN